MICRFLALWCVLVLCACDGPPQSYPFATGFTYHKADSTGSNVQPGPTPPFLGFTHDPACDPRIEARMDAVAQDLLSRFERETGSLPPHGSAVALTLPRDGMAANTARLGLYMAFDHSMRKILLARGYRLVASDAQRAGDALFVVRARPYSRPQNELKVLPSGMAEFVLRLSLYNPASLRGTKAGIHAPSAQAIYLLPSYNSLVIAPNPGPR